jgi:methyl-accepting chemotaxis protein
MNRLKNIKISFKLIAGFSFAVLSIFIISIIAISSLTEIRDSNNDVVNDKYVKTLWANNIIDIINKNGHAFRNMVLSPDPSFIKTEGAKIIENREKVNAVLDSIEANLQTEKARALFSDVTNIRKNEYTPEINKLLSLLKNNQTEEARALVLGELGKIENEYLSALSKMNTFFASQMNASAHDSEELTSDTILTMIIAGILLAVLLVGSSLVLIRQINKPLQLVKDKITQLQMHCLTNLSESLIAMEKGDLSKEVVKVTTTLNLEQKDEFGQMAGVIDKMIIQVQSGIDAYEGMRTKIGDLANETIVLIEDAKEGNLQSRGNTTKFAGAYRKIIGGINEVLDAIIKPVRESADALEIMATGDLTARITTQYKGEHQNIVNSINKLGESLSNLITRVNEAVYATVSSSNEISSSTEQMAAGAQEQSAQTSEIATAVEQMAKTIIETTQNAGAAAENARTAGKIAEEGGSVVKETVSGINNIAEVVSTAAEMVKQLGQSSDQIGEIIQVIDDIADQTNLLALNAAIEAARAGEQGRGFAVVADEVRKLAERTTKATKEIANMIKQIQKDTGEAVNSMKKGTEQVEKGKILANKAGQSLNDIIKATVQVVDDINQVATASEEQSTAAEQISKNIEAISSVTHQSASGIEQVAKAAEDLNRLTDNLQALTEKFKIETSGDTGGYVVRQNGQLIRS